jgi:Fe/S biogenesis protein NfuA
MIEITPNAQNYFKQLLEQQEDGAAGLRISVVEPGTPRAGCDLQFCPAGEQRPDDVSVEFSAFNLYVDAQSSDWLKEAVIDFEENATGGQLTIKAPNIKGSMPGADSPLAERVAWVLETEINPGLAGHGGMVMLENITDSKQVILRFGGGCHGCGMADVTLKDGIETTLKGHFPEITAVLDVTDHSTGENPYYAPSD